jgi:hypothetical protein
MRPPASWQAADILLGAAAETRRRRIEHCGRAASPSPVEAADAAAVARAGATARRPRDRMNRPRLISFAPPRLCTVHASAVDDEAGVHGHPALAAGRRPLGACPTVAVALVTDKTFWLPAG